MRRILAVLLLTACASEAGTHAVGFRIVDTYDKLRALVPGDYMLGRPLRLRLWYPALAGGRPITVREYVGEWAMSGVPTATWQSIVEQERRGVKQFERPVIASLDASPARGRHPAVIYVPDAMDTLEQKAAVAESLASHGFVVAVVPRLGDDVETLTADVRFINVELRGLSDVDERRIVIVARGTGAEVARRAAAADPTIRAVVPFRSGRRALVEAVRRATS